MKKLFSIILAAALAFPPSIVFAATGCSYPASLDSYSDKSTGDFVSVADWNNRSCAVEKMEAELGALPKGTYATVVARLNATFDKSGISGGQTAIGDTASGGALKLSSTAHATKGKIWFGTATTFGASSAYDETNVRLGIGTQVPLSSIHIVKAADAIFEAQASGTSVLPGFLGTHSRGTPSSPTATQTDDNLVVLEGRGYGATNYGSPVALFSLAAKQNFTDTAQGTYAHLFLVPNGSTFASLSERFLFDYDGLRIGAGAPDTSLHMALNSANHAAITFEESTAHPPDPSSGSQARTYLTADKMVIQYNDGGTVRYKYLLLTGTGATWTHTTTPP